MLVFISLFLILIVSLCQCSCVAATVFRDNAAVRLQCVTYLLNVVITCIRIGLIELERSGEVGWGVPPGVVRSGSGSVRVRV